jgi:hypothetical protein
MNTVYNAALVLHVMGITAMAGTTLIDFVLFQQLWKTLPNNKDKSIVLEDTLYRLQKFMGFGMLLIIISGIIMMFYLHQVWGQQLWFRVKMGLLLLIIINGLGLRRVLGNKLKKQLNNFGGDSDLTNVRPALKKNITIVLVTQLLFFIIVFVLSVFKFT